MNNFDLQESIFILGKTPTILRAYLLGLPEQWLQTNEGIDTWSPFDVLGHLIFGEKNRLVWSGLK